MDETNYFGYAEKLEDLESKKQLLEQRRKQKAITDRLNALGSSRQQYRTSVGEIKEACSFIVGHGKELEDVLKNGSGADHMNMSKESGRNLQALLSSIRSVMQHNDSINRPVELDEERSARFIRDAKKQVVDLQELHDNCELLVNNVHTLLSQDAADKENPSADVEISSSSNTERQRRSILSESSFLNTFQENNLSASSPITSRSLYSAAKDSVFR